MKRKWILYQLKLWKPKLEFDIYWINFIENVFDFNIIKTDISKIFLYEDKIIFELFYVDYSLFYDVNIICNIFKFDYRCLEDKNNINFLLNIMFNIYDKKLTISEFNAVYFNCY